METLNDSYFYTKGTRATLVDISTPTVFRNERYVRENYVRVRWASGYRDWLPMRDIIPVLRPFSALCKPLPDGTIPSVEISDIITCEPKFYNSNYLSKIVNNGLSLKDSIGIYLPSVDGISIISYYDWKVLYETENELIPYKVYDYLYSEHFAVGLKCHQFIEAV